MGIEHPRDLLFHLPYRYQDRTRITPIRDLQMGREAVVLGRIEGADIQPGRRRSLRVHIRDETDGLTLRFFHFYPAQQRGFQTGLWVRCYGEARRSGIHPPEMVHPEYRLYPNYPQNATEAALTPIYPTTAGIGADAMRKLVGQTLDRDLDNLQECLPQSVRQHFDLMPLEQALQTVHHPPPDADTDALLAGTHPAQQRLATEELLAHHLALARLREKHRARNAPRCNAGGGSWEKLQSQLSFTLTAAQQRVIGEVLADLAGSSPAMRLIQGDVGSGKTVVAAAAALSAIDGGHQAALMAPTELLSEQHRKTFAGWLEPLGIELEWLSGRMPAAARAKSVHRIQSGESQMVIGTHALFQQQVEFHRLGLMIVDEQHRFGVDQRLALRNKAGGGDDGGSGGSGIVPHQLIMSATPIPRSMAMIFYADLDISSIDELPPGRKPVHTVVLPNSRRAEVAARIRKMRGRKQQAYWVCPLIEESDKLQAQAATETRETLARQLPEVAVDLIHGRMKSAEKEEIMRRFHHGDIDLLVATTVIEVGVDVPAASLMIVENAERLGLAQLHQLRGRVGRGAQQAVCVLMYQPPLGQSARQRLAILRDTNDGFVIANQDLEQRGPGELLGTRQTGLQQMKVSDLSRDRALLPQVEGIARRLRAYHPQAIDPLIKRWISAREAYAEV